MNIKIGTSSYENQLKNNIKDKNLELQINSKNHINIQSFELQINSKIICQKPELQAPN